MEKWSIRAIASNMGMNLEEFSKQTGINENHLRQISAGNVKMLAEDLVAICDLSGLNYNQIKLKND